ncbi:glucoside xylosyltransferase 2-like isoform X1 [Branchiostoma lanceolatum]|uniref:glucoside xylosyltransferase 2-like isoform X1 n=1 Tax=Branchiostoma lanceolatum TaxID=7740 RepID=UPI0034554CAE
MRFMYRMGLLAGLGAVALFMFGYSLLNPSVAAIAHDSNSVKSRKLGLQLDDADVKKQQDSSKGDQDASLNTEGGLLGATPPALTCPVPMSYWFPPDACPLHQPLCGLYVCSPKAILHLAVVACGDRTNETLVMLKSAVIFTSTKLHCHIFAETELHFGFRQQIDSWPASVHDKLSYTIYPIMYPPGENSQEWKKLFRPCASQRLFLPEILTDVDSLLYVDTDILFLSPMENLWNFFSAMNSTQLAALAPEHEVKSIGWYNRFARHPYYGETGLNSGIMLMNLTRLRAFHFQNKIIPYYKEYKMKLTWGDQDLLNILFHFYPERLLVFPCEWNYRPDHCMYMQNCKSAETHGVRMVHGCRRVFFNEKQPAFKAIYQSIEQYKFDTNISLLLEGMKAKMEEPDTKASRCGQVANMFLKQVESIVRKESVTTAP